MGKGQELLDAAREGDKKTVEKILGHFTKRSGPFTSLRRGAGVNVQDESGYTPLHHACLRGHKEIVRLLLSLDASPCVVDKKGATALHLAAWKGDSDVVSMLLAHTTPPVNIDQLTTEQETALLIAAQFGNVDVVAQLLSRGADVNLKNIKDESPLDLAAQYGRLETVQHLLRARPALVDPYRYPVSRGRLFSSTPLHRASKNGHKEVVATLISAGMDPNVRTHSGTALHEAANYGKASVVRVLLAKGADLNVVDRRGNTVHDLLNEYSEEATKRVRRIIREHMAKNGYDSEEDLPPFPVQDYSPTGYQHHIGMTPPETHKTSNISLSPSSSSIKTNNPSSFVKKIASKLGIKAKFNSAPNIFNTNGEIDVSAGSKISQNKRGTILIGNSKFFKRLSKKEDSGEVVCNDEFDTISLDRLATLDRSSVVNRSNRSCPGFKTSLPNISENNELSESKESLADSIVITELDCENNNSQPKPVEAVNLAKLSIFEPRADSVDLDDKNIILKCSGDSAVNECYEPFEVDKKETVQVEICPKPMPKPPPRPTVLARKTSNEDKIYVNVDTDDKKVPPKPAARTHILNKEEKRIVYENVNPAPVLRRAPDPPVKAIPDVVVDVRLSEVPIEPKNITTIDGLDIQNISVKAKDSPSVSRTSTLSTDSMVDESNLEDIFLSKKSKSFKHGKSIPVPDGSETIKRERSDSSSSASSSVTEASAIENVDCSTEINEKSMYLSMTGTMPHKKTKPAVKKKVLFRHKTFTNIDADRTSTNSKDFPKWDDKFLKETLANYHIKGTGHCIYKSPTVQEFIYIFNRETLYRDVEPFTKVPSIRNSYFETAICFCKPQPPKHHKSAEDLLELENKLNLEEKVTIDLEDLDKRRELKSTSFQCFCDDKTCKFHNETRNNIGNLIVKFSAIMKSISTPDITLDNSLKRRSNLPKIKSVPSLEEPYAVVNVEDIIARKNKEATEPYPGTTNCDTYSTMSQPSTMSSSSRPYSIKDIAEEISLNESPHTSLTPSAPELSPVCLRKSSSSEHSGKWSLQSCNSNVTVKSDLSFKSCIEENPSSDDETLHSSDESDVESVKSEVSTTKRPWVHSDSFRFDRNETEIIAEEKESGIEVDTSDGESPKVLRGCASLERGGGAGLVRSGSGRRRWDEAEGTSEGDALSVSSAASSCAAHHVAHQHEYSKVSPTPPKKPPRRNLSVSPTHVNSPSSGYSYELRPHARSQDDLDDIQGAKHYLKHGRSVDHYVDSKLSYSEYEEHPSPRVPPIPNPRPSLKNRTQPVAITAMYENVIIKEQNPRRKLKRNNFENYEPKMDGRTQERSSLESLLDDTNSVNSPSDCERYYDGQMVQIPLSPSHYKQPPTPDHPPPSAKQAERSIHERIRPLSQEYKRRSAALRESYTEVDATLLRAASAASVASAATDRSGNTDHAVEEYKGDLPFAGLFKGSTTMLDGIGLRPVPAERPKTLRKLKSVYDTSPTDPPGTNTTVNIVNTVSLDNRNNVNGSDDEVRRRSNTTSSNQSGREKSLSILSPFDEQEEWAKISEIMASFGSKLVRESVFVSELEREFTSRLGLSCSESSLSSGTVTSLGQWLAGLGMQDYETLFIESGYDDVEFINGVLEECDLKEMGIDEPDRTKLYDSSKHLPLKIVDISNNYNNNTNTKNQTENVETWLKDISLLQYLDKFKRHLYIDMEMVRRIWDVELTAVLEIQKVGHRKRILASVSGQLNGPALHLDGVSNDLNNLKNNIQQLKDDVKPSLPENLKPVPPPVVPTLMPPAGETLKRSKKNRPAPQPPRPSDLEIRAPSELLVGVPGALRTQWKHRPAVLLTGSVTYVANYLGSTVVKELRGTESTKKSIQKLKKSTKEPRDSPDIILSISYRGVKFLNTITRELVCEHEVRNIHCACQDADDLTHFAYITKDHETKSHYCHVFKVATMEQATEVILTLGEAFEVAYQMALREQSNRSKVSQAKTPTHDPTTKPNEKSNVNHGRSHSITEIKLNGHQLKIAPIPASLSNEDFQSTRNSDGSRSPRTPLLKAPIASTEEL